MSMPNDRDRRLPTQSRAAWVTTDLDLRANINRFSERNDEKLKPDLPNDPAVPSRLRRWTKDETADGWSGHCSAPGCTCRSHGHHLDPRFHRLRPPGRKLRNGSRQPGHRRGFGDTRTASRFPQGVTKSI